MTDPGRPPPARLRRPALRPGDRRGGRVRVPPRRRGPRAPPRRRGADHVRARLPHLAKRLPRRASRRSTGSACAASPWTGRAACAPSAATRTGSTPRPTRSSTRPSGSGGRARSRRRWSSGSAPTPTTTTAFLFYTYLYLPTTLGLPLVAHKAVLVPTAHDERPIYLDLFRSLFRIPRGADLPGGGGAGLRRGALPHGAPPVGGHRGGDRPGHGRRCGAIPPPARARGPLLPLRRAGRRREGLPRARRRRSSPGASGPPSPPRWSSWGRSRSSSRAIRPSGPLGFRPEAEKHDAIAGATALVMPSPHESFSFVILEAWSQGTPVLATARSPVLRGHVERSGAGLLLRPGAGRLRRRRRVAARRRGAPQGPRRARPGVRRGALPLARHHAPVPRLRRAGLRRGGT